ncbi:MAG: hypothetical protein JRN62_08885 [Nitrososphaerota archaeon]|nr:hypothetical protein [Nitrososphaerota archaeon]
MKGRRFRDVRKELEELYKKMDAKKLKISEKEILDEIAAVRREKRLRRPEHGRV